MIETIPHRRILIGYIWLIFPAQYYLRKVVTASMWNTTMFEFDIFVNNWTRTNSSVSVDIPLATMACHHHLLHLLSRDLS